MSALIASHEAATMGAYLHSAYLLGTMRPWVSYRSLSVFRMYQPHPSKELTERFRIRPYQGADPATALFLFIGLDANYDPALEQSPAFRRVLEYHEDGVAFWRRHGVHHPFLLPEYRGDGRRYHRTFARIGFTSKHADLVSFLELLHVPSIGRNQLETTDLEPSHLQRINDVILNGSAKHIFISAGVARLMRSSKAFRWLPKEASGSEPLRVLYREPSRTVYSHLHFSNYGKFQPQLEREAKAIATLLPTTLDPFTEPPFLLQQQAKHMSFDFKNAAPADLKAEYRRIAKEIGDNQFFTKRELNHLPDILADGEQILAFASGSMDGSTWLITLTDRRIIFLDKGMIYGLKQTTIDLDKINAVSGETGVILGKIKIEDGAKERQIENIPKKTVVTFTNRVRDAIEARRRPIRAPYAAMANDVLLSNLERLARLKEKGMLSQQEFEQQKASLLAG